MRRLLCCSVVGVVGAVVVTAGCPGVAEGEGEGESGEGEGDSAEGEGEPPPPPPPPASCEAPIALRATDGAVVVGDGSAGSCDGAAFANAVAAASDGGSVVFNCGDGDVVVHTDAEVVVDKDLTIDGGGTVTLSGGSAHRLLRVDSTFDRATPRLTLQRLSFVDGRSNGDGSDPVQGGGAVFRLGGSLEVIDCVFTANDAPPSGQDVAGGAISSVGGGDTVVVGSSFVDNEASNGGALGNLGNALVVVNSAFVDNRATGTGGNPGDGGNGGTISVDGENQRVELCGVDIARSRANAFGGAFFRVAYNLEPTTMTLIDIDDAAIDDRDPSMGGGLYVQNSAFTLSSSTIRNSRAKAAGGAYVGPGSTMQFVDVTFDNNVALSSLAGAMFLDGVASGEVSFSTFVENRAPGEFAFGGAVTGDASRVNLTNSLFIDNAAGNGFNPITCTTSFQDGSDSFQFPVVRAGNGGGDGGSDDPQSLCAPDITVVDVDMGPVDDSGAVPVRRPQAGSAAVGVVDDCIAADASGRERVAPCAAGAAEP